MLQAQQELMVQLVHKDQRVQQELMVRLVHKVQQAQRVLQEQQEI